MVDINTRGIEAASLTDEQLALLNKAQAELNKMPGVNQEIYLLAVTRHR